MDDKTVNIDVAVLNLLPALGLEEEEVRDAIRTAEHVQIVNDFRREVETHTRTGKDIVAECHVTGNTWDVVYVFRR